MDEDFEKGRFFREVSDEFYRLSALRTVEKMPIEKLRTELGCVSIPIIPILQRMNAWALKADKEKRNYESLTDEVNAILDNAETRKAIRKALEELPKDEIVTEETFVRVFTETLSQNGLRQRLDIPLDPVLFALIGYGIHTIGIREYCRGDVP